MVAGRTDAGVHARGQVAHLALPPDPRLTPPAMINGIPVGAVAPETAIAVPLIKEAPRPALHPDSEPPPVPDTTNELLTDLRAGGTHQLLRRLNGTLPHDIRVRRVAIAHPDFDARFCGLSRTYSYRIADRPDAVDPLRRHDTLHWPRPLDLPALQAASTGLVGLHDFAAFCKKRENASTIRALLRLDWVRDEAGVLVATVQADAFCHSMVRSLVGALIAVGEGRQPADWPASLLSLDVRSSGVLVAPPQGLALEAVEYPPDDQLAARQQVTRNPRA
ncbi:MAG: tRNA pseudouridine synthase [Frankiales bacterium]|nr:tRNA pseudouridine synthase [Frankiales bacterium]